MQLITDPFFYLLAVPSVLAIGLSKGGFAGVGLLATPLLALYLPPLEAAALLLPILISQDMISVWWYRRDWDPWNLKVLIPGMVVGIALGWIYAAHVSDAAIRLVVGAIGVAFVLHAWTKAGIDAWRNKTWRNKTWRKRAPSEPVKKGALSGLFWGGVSGFTSFLTQGGGPPYQVHILPQRLPKLTLVGTTTIFFAITNALKIGPYFALGQFSTENFATSLALLPLAVATNALGIWLVRITPTDLFYRIAYVLVLVVSAVLMWQGVTGLFGGA